MKPIIVLISLVSLALLSACTTSQETIPPPATNTSPASTTGATGQVSLSPGMFMNNAHAVSGTVSIQEINGKQRLVFTNFKTDGGPDLRIYLAENTSLRNFIEVGRLTGSGNFSVDLPADANPAKQRFVLIWCKAFSVLFGHAELK
jgi:hypothetical protein